MILHVGLCLLVLTNLAFVHITGVVGSDWVLAFCTLTLLSPLLRRLAETPLYRTAWNSGVVVLFGSLLHRTLDHGVARMLEGGLVLAAFCQVHLVNNVSARQRPDLLIYNSFLIALITAFFCQELAYCAVFVGYTFTLLVVWRLLAHRDAAGTAPLALVLGDGARHALWVLLLTAAVFLLWPRDFARPGLVGEGLLPSAQADGFAEEIALRRTVMPLPSDHVVMRIHASAEVPAHWRATTYRVLHGGAWHASATAQDSDRVAAVRDPSADARWQAAGRGRWERAVGAPAAATFRVDLHDLDARRLLLPLHARTLLRPGAAAGVPHFPLRDGTFGYFAAAEESEGPVTYVVELGSTTAANPLTKPPRLDPWLRLDFASVPGEALTLAQQVRAGLPADAAPARVADALCARLREDFAYGLPGQADGARDLGEFFRRRRGHCEFFASALVMMLRSQRIPCRLVGGFLAVEREDDDTVVVRGRHAHAWVEAWDDARGWRTLDPTPASGEPHDGTSWFGRLLAAADAAWSAVTGFDEQRRARALAWLADLPARLAAAVLAAPWTIAAALLAAAFVWSRRRARRPAAAAAYERAVRRARCARAPGETPRALLARVRAAGLPAERIARLAAATAAHERARYRGEA
jgi:hypothetical protein